MAITTLYARPSDDLAPTATLSWAVSSANSVFPVTNAQNGNPAKPAKAIATTATLRATFGGSTTLEMMAVISHNLAGAASVTFTNNSGLSRLQTVPANTSNGLSVNFFDDFSAVTLGTRQATQWNLVVSTALGNVAIGEWLLISTKRVLSIRYGTFEQAKSHHTKTHVTDHGAKLSYWLGVSQRRMRGHVNKETERANILALIDDCKGQYSPFLFVPDSSINDPLYVDLMTDEQSIMRSGNNVADIDLDFWERQRGLAL